MRYLMMIKSSEQTENGQLPQEQDLLAMGRYNEELAQAGAMLDGDGLKPSSAGAKVKFSGGRPTVTDGPFAESKELIAGFWAIQARTDEEALEWARRCPLGPGGELELRRLVEPEDLGETFTEVLREQEGEQRAEEQRQRQEVPHAGGKRFMLLRMADSDTEADAEAGEQLIRSMLAYNQGLVDRGAMLGGDGLRPSREGYKVRGKEDGPVVTDGPFTEAKELIAGYTMIRAESLADAIEVAKRWPTEDAEGEVEIRIREVFELEDFGDEVTEEVEQQQRRIGEQMERNG